MSTDGPDILNLIKSGKMSLTELRQAFSDASASLVSVQDWGVCYSSATDELSEYCTVVANDSNNSITGVGIIAYSSNGSTMYCVQYTNGFNSTAVGTSVGTNLFNPQDGNSVLCVVYGMTNYGTFYLTDVLTIVPCQ